MKSRIFSGHTTHARLQPVSHRFRYRMYWFGIDLDELQTLSRTVGGFSHNRRALLSIRDEDYAGPGEGSIREKILAMLGKAQITVEPTRIMLMTIPRIAGYVFNPVNFFMCHDKDENLVAIVCEVRNTFGEVHHYVASPEHFERDLKERIFHFQKNFYVSPFLSNDGEYVVRARSTSDSCKVSITLSQGGEEIFTASMVGTGVPIRSSNAIATLLRLSLAGLLIMTRIQWQALLLRMRRKIHPVLKPELLDPSTIPARGNSIWYSIRSRLLKLASRSHVAETECAVTKEQSRS